MTLLGRTARVVVPLGLAAAAYPLLPTGEVRDLGFQLVGLLAVLTAFRGLARQGSPGRGWAVVLCAYLGWVLARSTETAADHVTSIHTDPGPADALRLGSYVVLAGGLLLMVRRRGEARDLTAALDVAVLAGGLAVVAGVFLVAPVAREAGVSLVSRVTTGAHPLADVLVLAVLVRLWTTPRKRSVAFRLLTGAVLLTLLGDVLHDYRTIIDPSVGSVLADELLGLAAYVVLAAAAWAPRGAPPAGPVPGAVEPHGVRRRTALLAVGLLLPGAALVVDGMRTGPLEWPVVAAGSLVVSLLVVARLGAMLARGQRQAVELAIIRRSDALTGIANRRTWDFELVRAAEETKKRNAPLTVVLLDVDRLDDYNAARGHPAGDRLLRDAARAWSELLEPGQVLARYGGDEFALLCPGLWAADVRPLVEAMLAATPAGQTVSAAIATWDPLGEPGRVMETATQFVAEAKRGGRNQIQVAPRPTSQALLPRPTMLWQPIVDLRSTRPLGVEALSRFSKDDPRSVFEAAASVGSGPSLEAVAITYALTNRPGDLWVAVNVSLEALASIQVQRALAGNLTGVVLELTEHSDSDVPDLAQLLKDYRARGARVAVDDWGPGISNLDRLVTLRPDIVKVDVSRVPSLDSDRARASLHLITSWAKEVGAQVCAERVETEEQWRQLCKLGVELGQGHFFGRPMPPEELLALPRDTAPPRLPPFVAPRLTARLPR